MSFDILRFLLGKPDGLAAGELCERAGVEARCLRRVLERRAGELEHRGADDQWRAGLPALGSEPPLYWCLLRLSAAGAETVRRSEDESCARAIARFVGFAP